MLHINAGGQKLELLARKLFHIILRTETSKWLDMSLA